MLAKIAVKTIAKPGAKNHAKNQGQELRQELGRVAARKWRGGRCRSFRAHDCDRMRQFGVRADQEIGVERRRRHFAVAEIDRDNRHTGRARGTHIGHGITDHDGALQFAAGVPDSQPQHLRIRLLYAERFLATDRREITAEIQSIEQAARKPFQLVGANREPASFVGKPLESAFEVRKRARAVGNMRAVMVDEDPKHAIKLGARHVSALGDQGAFDHSARAAANHSPRIVVGNRRQAFAGEDDIERRNQIGRGIDQCAVEIEDDGAHDSVLIPIFAPFREQNYVSQLTGMSEF
jgi:hypothetical protein